VDCDTLVGVGHDSGIVGGEIRARKSITVKTCGSDNSAASRLTLYYKNKGLIVEKINELTTLQEKLTADLEPIERQLKSKASMMKRLGENVTDRSREEVKKWVEAYNGIKKKVDFVAGKISELKVASENTGDRTGFISILDRCYPGVTIVLYDTPYLVKTLTVNKRFVCKDHTVTLEG
jgi:uncharacterized protein (DUF342 family)